MTKQTLLHVPEFCNENWNEMTASVKGRFCANCCKTVVDFSTMSDKEILQVLTKAAGKTCGRFTEEQLHRPLSIEAPVISKGHKIYLSAFIPTFLFANTVLSQNNKAINKKAKQSTEKIITKTTKGIPAVIVKEIPGEEGQQLLEKSSETIPPMHAKQDKRVIMGMVRPFKPCTIDTAVSITSADIDETNIKSLANPTAVANTEKQFAGRLGEVIAYKKVTFADTVKTIVRKTFNQQAFKVYANPASLGGNIYIQFKEASTYTIQLLDAAGRLYLSQIMQAKGNKQPVTIMLPSHALAGNYFIRAIDANKKKEFVDKIIIR
jgi:hypothetical protein